MPHTFFQCFVAEAHEQSLVGGHGLEELLALLVEEEDDGNGDVVLTITRHGEEGCRLARRAFMVVYKNKTERYKTASVQYKPLALLQVASEFSKKRQWGKLNKSLTRPTRQVMFWAKSNLPLFDRVAGQVEMPAGQVNFRGSLPRSENKV